MSNPCGEALRSICGSDFNGWVSEGRTDCPDSIWGSGVVRRDDRLASLANGEFWNGTFAFWDLSGNTITSDDSIGVPNVGAGCPPCNTLGQKKMDVRKYLRSSCWTADKFLQMCNFTGRDEVDAIVERIGQWGQDLVTNDLINMMMGLYANNIANNDGDLVTNLDEMTAEETEMPGFLTPSAEIMALCKFGCNYGKFTGRLVHEEVLCSLRAQGVITDVPVNCDDGNCYNRAYFNGKAIYGHSSDKLKDPVTGAYITILFEEGAFAYAPASMGDEALIYENVACGPNGMPEEFWRPYDMYVLHPVGWTNCYDPDAEENMTMTEEGPAPKTNEEPAALCDGDNWCRVVDCKSVGIAFIVHSQATP